MKKKVLLSLFSIATCFLMLLSFNALAQTEIVDVDEVDTVEIRRRKDRIHDAGTLMQCVDWSWRRCEYVIDHP